MSNLIFDEESKSFVKDEWLLINNVEKRGGPNDAKYVVSITIYREMSSLLIGQSIQLVQ